MEQSLVGFAGVAAGLGFLAAATLFAFRGKQSWPNFLFVLALLLTGLWAFSVALSSSAYAELGWASSALAALRDAGWFAAVIALLRHESERPSLWRRLALASGVLVVADLLFSLTGIAVDTGLGLQLSPAVAKFAVSIMGLILVENLVLNVPPARRWSLRLMAIGLTAIFGYNIILLIPGFLGSEPIESFAAAQPAVYLLALPLFVVTGVRNNSLKVQAHSSRNVVFHSTMLMTAGILLQGTAIAALYVRSFGGAPATALSIVLGFSGFVAVAVMFSSTAVRSQIRMFINENFYSYKYDYRLEWTKFIQALSHYQEQAAPERALRALTDLLDSPGGALWVRRRGWKQFVPLASWAFGRVFGPVEANAPILADIKDESVAFLEFANDEGSPCEAWQRRFPGAWLVVPLRFRDELTGFAVLARPRAARRLDWEDRNFIRLVAMQLALFLVHEQIAQELADSQQLIEFNNRVAFALHDLKNTIGQLNLIRHNAARFGDDPRFRADMMTSIGQAVENLQTLMGKLKNDRVPPSAREQPARIDVSAIVARCADRKSASGVIVRHGNGPVFADIANPEDFEGALEHVLSNAVEASRPGSNVQLSVEETNGRVRVKVEDSGPGMSPEFLANDFFRPLRTTKENGLGIGAYQARAMMRGLGGDMEVQSSAGQGTTVSLLLPACVDAERQVSQ